MTKTRLARLAGTAVLALALGACATVKNHRGYVSDEQLVKALEVGVDNRDSVRGTLGEPTFISRFPPNDWFYVANDTNQVAFNDPKIRELDVIRVQFDQAGNLTGLTNTGRELASSVGMMDGKTPTMGREGGLLDEIFGNVGAVGTPGLGGAGTGAPGTQ